MKKIAVPAIFAATLMIAAAFAFMPVQKASTVHTALLDKALVTDADNKARTDIATATSVLMSLKYDRPWQPNSIFVKASSDGAVIVESITVLNGAGQVNGIDDLGAAGITIEQGSGALIPTNLTVELPANWTIIVNGKGGAANSDSTVFISSIIQGGAVATVGP